MQPMAAVTGRRLMAALPTMARAANGAVSITLLLISHRHVSGASVGPLLPAGARREARCDASSRAARRTQQNARRDGHVSMQYYPVKQLSCELFCAHIQREKYSPGVRQGMTGCILTHESFKSAVGGVFSGIEAKTCFHRMLSTYWCVCYAGSQSMFPGRGSDRFPARHG